MVSLPPFLSRLLCLPLPLPSCYPPLFRVLLRWVYIGLESWFRLNCCGNWWWVLVREWLHWIGLWIKENSGAVMTVMDYGSIDCTWMFTWWGEIVIPCISGYNQSYRRYLCSDWPRRVTRSCFAMRRDNLYCAIIMTWNSERICRLQIDLYIYGWYMLHLTCLKPCAPSQGGLEIHRILCSTTM